MHKFDKYLYNTFEKMVHDTIQWLNFVMLFLKYENKLKIGWEK